MMKISFAKKALPFWVLTIGFMIALTLPKLIQDGMFLDAMLYTSVSHNLSQGIGTFWFPQFSSTYHNAGLSSFHEHPPLVFAIQSVFFKIFGSSMYVERFYTFLTMCITAFLINILWKEIYRTDEKIKNTGWLPVFFWITIPVCFWSYSNNMQENTMGIFTLSAVILIYKVLRSGKNETKYLIISGFLIFLATMSKGLPGFFPIGVPFLFWIFTRESGFRKTFTRTLILISVPALAYIILFNIPESSESLSFYIFERVLNRINENPTVGNRFFILYRLLMELLPQIVIATLIIVISRLKQIKEHFSKTATTSGFFVSIGLSASLPLMLTFVQRGFYFVPALPFFAIGLSVLIAPVMADLQEKIKPATKKHLTFLTLSVLLLLGTLGFSFLQIGKVSRDKDMLADVYTIGKVVPAFSEVTVPTEIFSEYVLNCYFVRYFNISLKPEEPDEFYMIRKTMNTEALSEYKKVELETRIYDLYQRN